MKINITKYGLFFGISILLSACYKKEKPGKISNIIVEYNELDTLKKYSELKKFTFTKAETSMKNGKESEAVWIYINLFERNPKKVTEKVKNLLRPMAKDSLNINYEELIDRTDMTYFMASLFKQELLKQEYINRTDLDYHNYIDTSLLITDKILWEKAGKSSKQLIDSLEKSQNKSPIYILAEIESEFSVGRLRLRKNYEFELKEPDDYYSGIWKMTGDSTIILNYQGKICEKYTNKLKLNKYSIYFFDIRRNIPIEYNIIQNKN